MLPKSAGVQLSEHLSEYAQANGIYSKTNFVNPDHAHILIDLPTNRTMEQVVKLLKGESSHWINSKKLLMGRFSWGRGYGAFSVSPSNVEEVSAYIVTQEEHHRQWTFLDEYRMFVEKHGLVWIEEGEMEE